MKVFAPQSSYAAKKEDLWSTLCAEVDALPSLAAVADWWTDFQLRRLRQLPPVFQSPLRDRLEDRRRELIALSQHRFLDLQYARAMERE